MKFSHICTYFKSNSVSCLLKDAIIHFHQFRFTLFDFSALFLLFQREKKIKEIQRGDSTDSSRDKPIHVTSLKRKPSERPALPPRPSLTSPVLRNSSGKSDNSTIPLQDPPARSAILQRSISGKTDSSVVSPVASGLRSNSSSDRDTVTSPDKPSASVLDSPSSSETSSAAYKPHYLHNVLKTGHTTSEDEVDTPRQTEPSLSAKPRITPRRLKPSSPDKEIWGPPASKPPEPPSKDAEMVDKQNSEERTLPPSTPLQNPQPSPPSSLSDPEEVQAPSSTNASIVISTVTTKVNTFFILFVLVSTFLVCNLCLFLDHSRTCQNGGNLGD